MVDLASWKSPGVLAVNIPLLTLSFTTLSQPGDFNIVAAQCIFVI